jgi:hypothetical protein
MINQPGKKMLHRHPSSAIIGGKRATSMKQHRILIVSVASLILVLAMDHLSDPENKFYFLTIHP